MTIPRKRFCPTLKGRRLIKKKSDTEQKIFYFLTPSKEIVTKPSKAKKEVILFLMDTPKFSYFKKDSFFIVEKENSSTSKFFFDGKKATLFLKEIKEELFPFLIIKALKKNIFIKERNLKGYLYYNVCLLNPVTDISLKFKDFLKIAEFNEECEGFNNLFLSNDFFDFLYELKIPFSFDPQWEFKEQDNLITVLRKASLQNLYQFEALKDFVLKDVHIEYLHEMRVALRRIRTYLGLFEKELGRKRAKRLNILLSSISMGLGRVRDFDIFLEFLKKNFIAVKEENERNNLLSYFKEKRDEAFEYLCYELRLKSFDNLVKRCYSFFSLNKTTNLEGRRDFLEAAHSKLKQVKRLIKKRMKKYLDSKDENDLHRVRISFKKFRYLFEIYSRLKKGHLKKMRKIIIKLQDLLGTYQDLRVVENIILEHSKYIEDSNLLLFLGRVMEKAKNEKGKNLGNIWKIYTDFDKIKF